MIRNYLLGIKLFSQAALKIKSSKIGNRTIARKLLPPITRTANMQSWSTFTTTSDGVEKSLFADRKWITLTPGDGEPFSIKIDASIEIVDDLKKAVKKEKANTLRDIDADQIQLEYPSGTALAPNSLSMSKVQGGSSEQEPIIARLPQPGQTLFSIPMESGWIRNIWDTSNLPQIISEGVLPVSLIGIEACITQAEILIEDQIGKATDTRGAVRKEPIVCAQLARGGKTTILCALFDALKSKPGYKVMIITFNGTGGFTRREGESAKDAILRQIAIQLVDTDGKNPELFNCLEDDLRTKLDADIGEDKFVLIIDELNVLGVPLDAEASAMLKSLFLDPKNRMLVFSSHVPMSVNDASSLKKAMTGSSDRMFKALPTPESYNLAQMRSMSPFCEDLTMPQVALYGGNPALIFSVKNNHYRVITKYTTARQMFPTSNVWSVNFLREFIGAVLTGDPPSKVISITDNPPMAKLDPLILFVEQFSFNREQDKIVWPICYMWQILDTFQTQGIDVRPIISPLKQIVSISSIQIPALTLSTGIGLDWQCVIQLSSLLWSIHVCLSPTSQSHPLIQIGDSETVEKVKHFTLVDCKSLEDCRLFIYTKMSDPTNVNTLCHFSPQSTSFPYADDFIAFKGKDPCSLLLVNAIQVKRGEKPANKSTRTALIDANWINEVYWIRGRAPQKSSPGKTADSKFKYLSEMEIKDILGYSLKNLYEPFCDDSYGISEALDPQSTAMKSKSSSRGGKKPKLQGIIHRNAPPERNKVATKSIADEDTNKV